MNLTPEQIERLRDWAAGKMGWHRVSGLERIKPNASATAWYELDGRELWVDAAGFYASAIGDWHPETSLDQAVMVARQLCVAGRKNGSVIIEIHWTSPYKTAADESGLHVALDDNPATALLLACAKAEGYEVGNETIA